MHDNLYAHLSPREREARADFLHARRAKEFPPLLPFDLGPLNVAQRHELECCENIISTGLKYFIDVGAALLKIRNGRLYKDTHPTFEAYCRERWQLGRSHANRLIDASAVVGYLSPVGDKMPLPTCEAQVRPLVGLPMEAAKDVWAKSVEEASNGKITAAKVRKNVMTWKTAQGEFTPSPAARLEKLFQVNRNNFWDLRQFAQRALSSLESGEAPAASQSVQSILELVNNILEHGFRVVRDDGQYRPEFEI